MNKLIEVVCGVTIKTFDILDEIDFLSHFLVSLCIASLFMSMLNLEYLSRIATCFVAVYS